jgi:hypothetical protein
MIGFQAVTWGFLRRFGDRLGLDPMGHEAGKPPT